MSKTGNHLTTTLPRYKQNDTPHHTQVQPTEFQHSNNHINSKIKIKTNINNPLKPQTTTPLYQDSHTHSHIKNEMQTNHRKKLHSIKLGKR
jgi:hypothetical protein